jgi:hypothetical protein
MTDTSGLSESEFVWLPAWRIADGRWSRIGLEEVALEGIFAVLDRLNVLGHGSLAIF